MRIRKTVYNRVMLSTFMYDKNKGETSGPQQLLGTLVGDAVVSQAKLPKRLGASLSCRLFGRLLLTKLKRNFRLRLGSRA